MATDKPRFSVTFSDEMFSNIQKFKEENSISTQSGAVAKLVELAIGKLEADTKKSSSAAEAAPEDDVFQIFDYLNDALVSAGLIHDGEDITDKQAEVLLGICSILRATFDNK